MQPKSNFFKKALHDWKNKWENGANHYQDGIPHYTYPIAIAIIPAILYLGILYIFNSHRLSFFIGIPIGIIINFFTLKLVSVLNKVVFYLLIAASFVVVLAWVGYIIYYIFIFFRWIWYHLPN